MRGEFGKSMGEVKKTIGLLEVHVYFLTPFFHCSIRSKGGSSPIAYALDRDRGEAINDAYSQLQTFFDDLEDTMDFLVKQNRKVDERMMFATCEAGRAKLFLSQNSYRWLNDAAKEYVLENLHVDMQQGFRVQDPEFHTSPVVCTQNAEMYARLTELAVEIPKTSPA